MGESKNPLGADSDRLGTMLPPSEDRGIAESLVRQPQEFVAVVHEPYSPKVSPDEPKAEEGSVVLLQQQEATGRPMQHEDFDTQLSDLPPIPAKADPLNEITAAVVANARANF